jgi:hypothetical protein
MLRGETSLPATSGSTWAARATVSASAGWRPGPLYEGTVVLRYTRNSDPHMEVKYSMSSQIRVSETSTGDWYDPVAKLSEILDAVQAIIDDVSQQWPAL